jgi:selenocysteine-specific elongation factor
LKRTSNDAETLLTLARENGLRGVRESQAEVVLPLSASEIAALAQRLEADGVVRILTFSPLFLVSRESVDFLGRKIVAAVARFHEAHPEDAGIPLEQLKKRFDVPARVFLLAMKSLVHEKVVRLENDRLARTDFVRKLPPREEQLLRRIESAWGEAARPVLTWAEVQERLDVRPQTLEKMIGVLIERGGIVECGNGFLVQTRWLDGVIAKVRNRKRKELTVAEFKTLTGLSRKFAIPLLELLDECGVTRRNGASRDIV